jgi:hypothetical protein
MRLTFLGFMEYNYRSMKKINLLYLLLASSCFSQDGTVYETYKYNNGSTNSSRGSVFNKPFQEYNYVKTSRGIEVYETYKYKYAGSTNASRSSVISKPFPEYVIVNDKIYRTYKYENGSTNQSHGSVFNKPFEADVIDPNANKIKTVVQRQSTEYKPTATKYNGPTYDGETYSSGAE